MSSISTPHLIASAERWGDQAFARICKIVVDSNDGINQSVMENRTDLFDLMSNEDLIKGDDLGLSVAYSAIFYDQPDIIQYLHKRGIDLSQPCDPMGYGTPLFYAVMMSKLRLIMLLHKLGYSLQKPCETTFNQTPLHYAKKKGVFDVVDFITKVTTTEERAKNLLHKNMIRRYYCKKFQVMKRNVTILQSLYRARLARNLVRKIKSGEVILESDSEEEDEVDEDHLDGEKSRTSLSHVEEESREDENSVDPSIREPTIQEEGDEEEDGSDEEDDIDSTDD